MLSPTHLVRQNGRTALKCVGATDSADIGTRCHMAVNPAAEQKNWHENAYDRWTAAHCTTNRARRACCARSLTDRNIEPPILRHWAVVKVAPA